MAYADYAFYVSVWGGGVLTQDNAAKWLGRAGDEIDSLTSGRLRTAFPTEESDAVSVKKAVCAVADILCRTDAAAALDDSRREAAAAQSSDAVASAQIGDAKVAYAGIGELPAGSVYARAARFPSVLTRLICGAAAKYISDTADADGVNLFYRGRQ